MTVAEGVIVDVAALWPNRCVFDGETHGPFLDTLTEGPNGERNYVCARCAGYLAVRFGLVAGSELERLRQIEVENSQLRNQIDAALRSQQQAEHDLEEERRYVTRTQDELGLARQQVTQLERMIESVRGEVSSIGPNVAPPHPDSQTLAQAKDYVHEPTHVDPVLLEDPRAGLCPTAGDPGDGNGYYCEREYGHEGAHGIEREGQFLAFTGPPPVMLGDTNASRQELVQPTPISCSVNGCVLPFGHEGLHGYAGEGGVWTVLEAPEQPAPAELVDAAEEAARTATANAEQELVDAQVFPAGGENEPADEPEGHAGNVDPDVEPDLEEQGLAPPAGRPQQLAGFLQRQRDRKAAGDETE